MLETQTIFSLLLKEVSEGNASTDSRRVVAVGEKAITIFTEGTSASCWGLVCKEGFEL